MPLLCTLLAAQDGDDTFGHSRHGAAFDEGPRRAAYLMRGLNDRVHFPVDGLSAEAQRFFDQGICQQHGFWYFEAERSFRQVAMLHPDCAMAYWGMARANDEDAPRAAGLLCAAVQRSAAASEREQRWIDAWARYYQIDEAARAELRSGDAARIAKATADVVAKNEDRKGERIDAQERALIKDLGTIVFEHPDDVEAKAFLALQNWLAYRWGSGVQIVSHAAVDALLQQVFAEVPDHPAHHYAVHLWDQEDARRALASAAKIGDSAPAIAHQWHMAGHIYAKLDRHAEAAWQQDASSRCDHAHMMRDRVMPFLIHNYGHNQEWLARSLAHCGRVDEALDVAKNLAALPRHPKFNRVARGDEIAGYAQRRLVQLCEEHGLWQQALALCDDGYLEASDDVIAEVRRLSLLGRARFRLGQLAEAEQVVSAADALLGKARAERAAAIDDAEAKAHAEKAKQEAMRAAIAEAGREPSDAVQAVLDLQRELRGERLLLAGDGAAALAEFEAIDGLSPLLLADAQVAAGKVDEAIAALEQLDEKRPDRAATKRALLRAYAAGGEPFKAKAREVLVWSVGHVPTDYAERCMDIGVDPPRALGAATVEASAEAVARDTGQDFPDDFGPRPPLASLGPRAWSPVQNPGFELAWVTLRPLPLQSVQLQADGRRIHSDYDIAPLIKGRATLVVFYLGFGCLHCVEQLHALRPLRERFAAAGIDVVAIGSASLADTRAALRELPVDQRMPFPMLADPQLAAFQAWHCFDDFERMPLHGVFLVDERGRVRWQDISAEPFLELDWLLAEAQRLLALPSGNPPR